MKGKTVRVYRNLHRKCFSVQTRVGKRWKVTAHVDEIRLRDVSFLVHKGGHKRYLRERRKNVHAFVVGTMVDSVGPVPTSVFYSAEVGYFHTRMGVVMSTIDEAYLVGGKIYVSDIY